MEMGGSIYYINITVAAVRRKIKNLRSESAAGPDSLGPRVLKELERGLAPALTHIYRRSLAETIVPADWKKATSLRFSRKVQKVSLETTGQSL